MRFEQISYWGDGDLQRVYVANPIETNVMGGNYVHAKQVDSKGSLKTAPQNYQKRHLPGDGMVWVLIPSFSIQSRIEVFFNEKEGRLTDDRPASSLAA